MLYGLDAVGEGALTGLGVVTSTHYPPSTHTSSPVHHRVGGGDALYNAPSTHTSSPVHLLRMPLANPTQVSALEAYSVGP